MISRAANDDAPGGAHVRVILSEHPTTNGVPSLQVKSPWWLGYVVTIAAEAALSTFLLAIEPRLPLGKFPIAYILVVMAAAYFFGLGPAFLAFILGFCTF